VGAAHCPRSSQQRLGEAMDVRDPELILPDDGASSAG
jgi:hypothetical protein